MSKQFKQSTVLFDKRLESCTDELSFLLDLIYKYPQQQRQKYYDRIQLLKQNLTHIKICLKDNPDSPTLNTLEKKYQQVYIKINQLKGQINSCEFANPNKKKKSNLNDITPLFVDSNLLNTNPKSHKNTSKTQYDSIMEMIVQKEDQVKKYKTQAEQHLRMVKEYEDNQQKTKQLIQNLQKQLQQIRDINKSHFGKIQSLEMQLLNKNQQFQQLQGSFQAQKQSSELLKQQLFNLRTLLQQLSNNLKLKKSQAENYATQFIALQQKHKYDTKLYIQREQMCKMKQRNYEKKVNDLEKQLSYLIDADKTNKDLILQNLRLKQDTKVFQAQLTLKQQQLYEKNRKIQAQKNQFNQLKIRNQQILVILNQKQLTIQKLLVNQKDNQNIILLLQKKIKELQQFAAQIEQKNLLYNKKIMQLQINLKQIQNKLKNKDQQHKKLITIHKKTQQNYLNIDQQRQKTQKQLDRLSLQLVKSQKKINQINSIMSKVEQQKNDLYLKLELSKTQINGKQQNIKDYQKQIQNLKKRLLRAKIQSIHNLRQVLL